MMEMILTEVIKYNSDHELLMHHSITDVALTSSIRNKPNTFDSVCPEHLN